MNAPQDTTALAVSAPATSQALDLSPRNFEEALRFSEYLADSDFVPKDYKGKPGNCLVGMQWGAELGLKPLQSLQNIAVINGRPALWGDSVIALVRSSPLCEYILESDTGTEAVCKVKRRGEPEQIRTFSVEDARTAGLQGKQGPWTQHPKRMRQMRARAFALRDVFPDVLRGLPIAEEVMDIPTERHMGPVDEVRPAATPTPAPQAQATWPDDAFAKNLPRWTKAVAEGLKTPAEIVTLALSKGALTPTQKAQLEALKRAEAALPPADTSFEDALDAAGAEGSQQ